MRPIDITAVRIWIFTALALAGGALGAYIVMQQIERHGANDPQVQLAEDGADALERGRPVSQVVPADTVDVARSLAPFIVVLDDAARPIASSGRLDGQIPIPPAGVFAAVRRDGEERVTWAPRRSVRLASVVRRVQGSQPGFIVAARSLRETEARIGGMGRMILTAWVVAMVGLTVAAALVGWLAGRPRR